jgi:hypothetical protein
MSQGLLSGIYVWPRKLPMYSCGPTNLSERDVGGQVDGGVGLHLLQGEVERAAHLIKPAVAGAH